MKWERNFSIIEAFGYCNGSNPEVWDNGQKFWETKEFLEHRVGAPALICSDGYKSWHIKGDIIKIQESLDYG